MSVSRGRSEPRYTRVSGTESEPLGVIGSFIPERAGDHKGCRKLGASIAITSVLKDGSEPNLQTWMVRRERAVISESAVARERAEVGEKVSYPLSEP